MKLLRLSVLCLSIFCFTEISHGQTNQSAMVKSVATEQMQQVYEEARHCQWRG